MKKFMAVSLVGISLACVSAARAADGSKLDARVEAAHDVLHELMATPDKGIPLDIAAKAHCVLVVPGFKKGAFLVGAQYGQGVATCRTGTGWSAPVFIQLTGASFGLQAGGQSTDLVLVGVNERSLDDLLKDKVKLGGDIAAAAWRRIECIDVGEALIIARAARALITEADVAVVGVPVDSVVAIA